MCLFIAVWHLYFKTGDKWKFSCSSKVIHCTWKHRNASWSILSIRSGETKAFYIYFNRCTYSKLCCSVVLEYLHVLLFELVWVYNSVLRKNDRLLNRLIMSVLKSISGRPLLGGYFYILSFNCLNVLLLVLVDHIKQKLDKFVTKRLVGPVFGILSPIAGTDQCVLILMDKLFCNEKKHTDLFHLWNLQKILSVDCYHVFLPTPVNKPKLVRLRRPSTNRNQALILVFHDYHLLTAQLIDCSNQYTLITAAVTHDRNNGYDYSLSTYVTHVLNSFFTAYVSHFSPSIWSAGWRMRCFLCVRVHTIQKGYMLTVTEKVGRTRPAAVYFIDPLRMDEKLHVKIGFPRAIEK